MTMTTREAFEKGTDTLNAHDIHGFAEVLADDVVFVALGGMHGEGKAACVEFYGPGNVPSSTATSSYPLRMEISGSGGILRGRCRRSGGTSPRADTQAAGDADMGNATTAQPWAKQRAPD